jgi:hypothetical protein
MPKLFVHTRQGTFTAEARVRVAAALTDLGIACEHLADTARFGPGSGYSLPNTRQTPSSVAVRSHRTR